MSGAVYSPARAIASRAHAHFVRHLRLAAEHGREDLAPVPDEATIAAIVDVGFWASLRREEGRAPKISIAYVPPTAAGRPLTFESWLPLTPASLAKLAPAVERPGIHLGVWPDESGVLRVWGTTRELPHICLVLEVVASGLLVIKHRGETFGKFVNVAVIEGDELKIVDEGEARRPDCPKVVASLLGVDVPGVAAESAFVLVQMAASMRAHGRGGLLLVVPSGGQTWAESIISPVLYAVDPPYTELATLVRQGSGDYDDRDWQDALRRAVDAVAGLTAVDGATLITDQFDLMAFGAKIMRRRGNAPVEGVMLVEPVEGSEPRHVTPYQLGGTRHSSAAQFVHDQRDATALVASQDGRFTICIWSATENIVYAHRVEALLL